MHSAQVIRQAPLKVLAVIPGQGDGADMIFCRRQVAELERSGVHIEAFYLFSRTNPFLLCKEWLRFRQEIFRFQPDLIHAHYGTMTGFFCAFGTRKPIIITFRGSELLLTPGIGLFKNLLGVLLSQISLLRATRIICVSKELVGRLWWRKSRAVVLPTGVDTRIFYPCPVSEARKELGFNDAEKIIIFNAGNNPIIKRLDLAEKVFAIVKQKIPHSRLIVMRGDIIPDKVPVYFSAADCLLLTSCHEGSPTCVQEAMACNLPVVTVDVGDVRERLEKVRVSKIVSRDPFEIAQGVIDILAQSKRSDGSAYVAEISQAEIARRTIQIYFSSIAPAGAKLLS